MSGKMNLELIQKYGTGSNSFLTLYEGYEEFRTSYGSIAYVNTPHAWVAATEPLCPPEHSLSVLNAFRDEAKKNGKEIFALPVTENFAQDAKAQGYATLMIGTEPVFELDHFFPDFKDFHSAKHLGLSGAKVLSKSFSELTDRQKAECDTIFHEWLESRWMAPLSFLNEVSPWQQGIHKRYFILYYEGQCLGFLAAVPVWANQGWYFVDLLKRNDAPPGTAEIILLEAMRILKEEGTKWISLGLSPLSGLEKISWADHPLLYKILNTVFHHGNVFYRFAPLFEFKKKLRPSSYPFRYLIGSPQALKPKGILSLLQAFVPGGILKMASSSVAMKLQVNGLLSLLPPWIRPDFIPRALPKSWTQVFRRSKLTLAVAALSIAMSPFMGLKQTYGFSWNHLKSSPLLTLLTAPWLHENLPHLFTNLALMLGGMLFLELLVGTSLSFVTFLLGATLANPLTLGALKLVLKESSWLSMTDVGASLGIFSCLGAFCFLLKGRTGLALLLNLLILISCLIGGNWMSLNHCFAFWIGFGFHRLYFQGLNARGWILPGTALGLLLLFIPTIATAEGNESWSFLPESRHQLFQTYSFFTDEQCSLLYRTAGRAWGEAGGDFALLDTPWFSSWKSQPQIVFLVSANAGYRLNTDSLGVFTDTIDARIGFNLEAEPSQGHHFSLGFLHMSGHISDDIQDPSLIGPNFGWEEIRLRYSYTGFANFKIGGTLSPIYSSDPLAKVFAADQFFEWYPYGLSSNRRKGSLYFAAGLEEYGAAKIQLTGQAQLGYLFGNHDRPVHEPSLRFAIGYYNGADPRLKYMGFLNGTTHFGYAGVFVDL